MSYNKGKKFLKIDTSEPTLRVLAEEYLLECQARGLFGKWDDGFDHHYYYMRDYVDADMPITQIDWVQYYADMYRRTDLAHNSIVHHLKQVKVLLHWVERKYGYSFPMPRTTLKETVKETYTDEELLKLIARPKTFKKFCEYRNWVIVCFLIDTGVRAGTLRNIKVKDINFDDYSFVTRHTKTDHLQVLPFNRSLAKEFKQLISMRDAKPDDYLFCDVFGQQMSAKCLIQAVRQHNLSRGVTKISTHLFRHTFARKYLVDCGGDAFKLQQLLGHSDLEMTKRYCRIFSSDLLNDNKSPLETLKKPKKIKIS